MNNIVMANQAYFSPMWIGTPQKEINCHISKMAIFFKILWWLLYKRYKVFTYKSYRHICRTCGRRTRCGLYSFPLGALGSMLLNMWTWNSNSSKIHNVGPSLYCVSTFLALFWPTNKLQPDAQNLWVINGHFPTISSQLFAKYMNIFHKTEVQTIILRYWTGLKLNWNKTYVFPFSIFLISFCEKLSFV